MNITLWIMQSVVALIFFGGGAFKTFSPQKKMEKMFPPPILLHRLLGFLEMLGAVGITVPLLLNVYPSLTVMAAVCLAIVMVGATILHLQKKEYKVLPLVITLFILCVTISIGRY